ncbi:hypothetical protein PMAYCL1PPCAC_27912, partial [Pristionchus mayeri]
LMIKSLGENNRPELNKVILTKAEDGIRIRIYLTNISFYDLDKMCTERYKISTRSDGTILTVTLAGIEDPIFGLLASFLST